MPLVTRQANQGRLFVEDTEPTNSWQNGDLWIDTSVAPPLANLNDSGTATGLVGAGTNITINSTTLTLRTWLLGV